LNRKLTNFLKEISAIFSIYLADLILQKSLSSKGSFLFMHLLLLDLEVI
jgi:hypothetical protein